MFYVNLLSPRKRICQLSRCRLQTSFFPRVVLIRFYYGCETFLFPSSIKRRNQFGFDLQNAHESNVRKTLEEHAETRTIATNSYIPDSLLRYVLIFLCLFFEEK